jgi:2,3-diaminopropionate biosynthesis protein SbnA
MIDGILSAIGNTPLVRLSRLFRDIPFNLYAKLEALNPGGSMKDRPALSMIMKAIEMGDIQPGAIVVESSSGNMGIGLAQVCTYLGLRFICVVDPKTTAQNIRLLESFGCEVDLVREPDPETGEFLQARLNRVRYLLETIRGSFCPNQYANIHNPIAHHRTMEEIVTALGGAVDYVFCATSTCGTMRGCAEYVRRHELSTKVIAVDAVGSVIFGGPNTKRLIPGHGAAVRPALFQPDLADDCIHVTDLDCVVGCRRLARQEAILAGGSSGAVVSAVDQAKDRIPPNATCAVILADRGERYLDTIYSDVWVEEHFGDVFHLWEEIEEPELCETIC